MCYENISFGGISFLFDSFEMTRVLAFSSQEKYNFQAKYLWKVKSLRHEEMIKRKGDFIDAHLEKDFSSE